MMIMERVKTSVLILKLNLCSSILAELNDPVTTTFSDSESGIVYSGGVWYGLWFVLCRKEKEGVETRVVMD